MDGLLSAALRAQYFLNVGVVDYHLGDFLQGVGVGDNPLPGQSKVALFDDAGGNIGQAVTAV